MTGVDNINTLSFTWFDSCVHQGHMAACHGGKLKIVQPLLTIKSMEVHESRAAPPLCAAAAYVSNLPSRTESQKI